jgi:hypothetical protein
MSFSSDSDGDLIARLVITVPADGTFILAADGCCDTTFSGGGNDSYQMSITPFHAIGSISGRVVDAQTGSPLPGGVEPFAFVFLHRCDIDFCEFAAEQAADSQGRFLFTQRFDGLPLEVGQYQVQAFANQYQFGQSSTLDVAAGNDGDFGDVGLEPNPVQFSDIVPCADLPPEGGRCRYSVRVTNRLPTKLKDGRVWSNVLAFRIGSFVDFTFFQAGKHDLDLRPGRSKVFEFDFKVPETVRDGASICPDAFVGNDKEKPYFHTLGTTGLFCITKTGDAGISAQAMSGNNGGGGFKLMPKKEAYELFRQRQGHGMMPRKMKP